MNPSPLPHRSQRPARESIATTGDGLAVTECLAVSACETVVVVMARSPVGDRPPKTRLAGLVAADTDRRRLYTAFLQDTIAACRTLGGAALRVAYAPDGCRASFDALGVSDDELLPQRGADLGERERAVFADLFTAGFSKVVLIGSDLPTLPMGYLIRAIEALTDQTVALGPVTDGGYYLIGLIAPVAGGVPDLFTEVRWGTSSAFEDTVAAARRVGLHVQLVPPWYDVDDDKGLTRLRRELVTPPGATRAPSTANVMRELFGEAQAVERHTPGPDL